METRARLAHDHHQAAAQCDQESAWYRGQRDTLVRELRADDPGRWTYRELADHVGCSPELIARIIKTTEPL